MVLVIVILWLIICMLQGGESFFRSVLASMEAIYLNRNPTAKSILELVRSVDNEQICYDHFAFRTFGVRTTFLLSFSCTVDVVVIHALIHKSVLLF